MTSDGDKGAGDQGQSIHSDTGGLTAAEFRALLQARDQVVAESGPSEFDAAISPHPAPGDAAIAVDGADVVTDDIRRAAGTLPSCPLAEVLTRRRSATATTRLGAVSLPELLAVLSRAYRVQDAGTGANGAPWTLRPVPSAGATHPFDLLVTSFEVTGLPAGHFVFDPHRVGLRPLDTAYVSYAEVLDSAVLRAARRTVPAPATVCLLARVDRVGRRYSAPLTLLVRDAGVLAQTLHLLATDLGLASSIIGSAGHVAPAGPANYPARSVVADCGAVILGRPVTP